MAEDIPHPRDVFDLQGHDEAELAFEDARARGRLHHAWLLTGPEGLGKATFAFRAARRLLGAPHDPAFGILGVDPRHAVSRQVMARAHPDLLVLERVGEDSKPRRIIPVDEARKLSEFFSKSPATAPHRVAIIDAADDLNMNAANAVLKTLEEPPPQGVLLLVSHAPGGLLPTIRSRCRRLGFSPLGGPETARFVADRAGVSVEDSIRLGTMSGGAPGRAWRLARAGAVALDDAAKTLLADLPDLDEAMALALTDRFRGAEGAATFNLLFDRLADRIHSRVRDWAQDSVTGLDPWVRAWESLQRLPREVEGVNLDRTDALFTALTELRAAART
ncbi:MAG: DNA polymerase III subunit delta' [Phenylobacterium zucineum]|nr:MAG: DNA polymerase III subunit delta' [Phenylobacterium zucineum]